MDAFLRQRLAAAVYSRHAWRLPPRPLSLAPARAAAPCMGFYCGQSSAPVPGCGASLRSRVTAALWLRFAAFSPVCRLPRRAEAALRGGFVTAVCGPLRGCRLRGHPRGLLFGRPSSRPPSARPSSRLTVWGGPLRGLPFVRPYSRLPSVRPSSRLAVWGGAAALNGGASSPAAAAFHAPRRPGWMPSVCPFCLFRTGKWTFLFI